MNTLKLNLTNGGKTLLLNLVRAPGWAKLISDIYAGGKLITRLESADDVTDDKDPKWKTWSKQPANPAIELSDKEQEIVTKAFKHFVTQGGSIGASTFANELIDGLQIKD